MIATSLERGGIILVLDSENASSTFLQCGSVSRSLTVKSLVISHYRISLLFVGILKRRTAVRDEASNFLNRHETATNSPTAAFTMQLKCPI